MKHNGNISWLSWRTFSNSDPWSLVGYSFDYDKANRLKKADFGYYSSSWQTTTAGDSKNFSYDRNGNIQSFQRYEMTATGSMMDDLTYNHYDGTNKLEYISDTLDEGASYKGVDDQDSGNYTYDANGNLITDDSKDIASVSYDYQNLPYLTLLDLAAMKAFSNITFTESRTYEVKETITVQGASVVEDGADITMRAGTEIRLKPGFHAESGSAFKAEIDASLITQESQEVKYAYDASGARVSKTSIQKEDYYIRDLSGNVFATYDGNGACDQIYLYGNDMIGDFSVATGDYRYYLKDHLGSIRVTVEEDGSVANFNDFYPFGYTLNSQQFSQSSRWKFSSKELDQDDEGNDLWYYFEARDYDGAIGRFLSIDPNADVYPSLTPYHYVGNNPLNYYDPTGMDSVYVIDQSQRPADDGTEGTSYTATIVVVQNNQVIDFIPNEGGSAYPNSVSNTNNDPAYNTVNEGTIPFNNQYGHTPASTGITERALNLVNDQGQRQVAGTSPTDQPVTMYNVNAHEGHSNLGNYDSRGSHGCPVFNPSYSDRLLNVFDWSGQGGVTGASTGNMIISRQGNMNIPREVIKMMAPVPKIRLR